jgi:hypothetical protein
VGEAGQWRLVLGTHGYVRGTSLVQGTLLIRFLALWEYARDS